MKLKKLLAAFLTIVTFITVFGCMTAVPAAAATSPTVYPVNLGKTYTYTVTYDNYNDSCWVEFSLSSAGVVRFRSVLQNNGVNTDETVRYYMYNTNTTDKNAAIWQMSSSEMPKNDYGDCDILIGLEAGTYRVEIDPVFFVARDQSRVLSFLFEHLPFDNYETESNNTQVLADSLTLGEEKHGFADNSVDYYSIYVAKDTPARIHIGNFTNLKAETSITVTKSDGSREYLYGSNTVVSGNGSYFDTILKKGTNYICVNSVYAKQVDYSVKVSEGITVPAPVINNLKISGTRIDVSWNELTGINGYEIWRKVNSKDWELILTGDSKTIGFWQTGTNFKYSYQFKVRAYKQVGGTKIYSAWSKVKKLNPTPTNVKLSTTSYEYNGKAKKPSVTVKDKNGKKLTKDKDYTVKYSSSSCKKIGSYKVTITFIGDYTGKVTKTFKINPKKTSLSSLTKGSKQIKVKWKKQTSNTSGYQIQYSTSSKFSSAKTVTIKKNTTTSTTIKKLKAKKYYYVRVRTYKTVSGTKYYSSWSSAKKVKTK